MAKLSLFLLLALLPSFIATTKSDSSAQQCRMDRLSASRPSQRMESEGGVIELWDQNEEQMQCAGVGAARITIRSQCLYLPNFDPSPRLVYIMQGRGIMGISMPGCPETFISGEQSTESRKEQQSSADRHQKIHRVKAGDIVAIPPGMAQWCYNDGNEELVAIAVVDVNSMSNQLDSRLKSFYLAGGLPNAEKGEMQGERRQTNIVSAFDTKLMAEATGIQEELMRRIQKEDQRGVIVKVREEGMSMIIPGEEEESFQRERRDNVNGLEQTFCNMKLKQNIDRSREADVFSKEAGRLNSVNMNKLPILSFMDMSAEKGALRPKAILAPHWSINAHTIVFVTRGEGRLQVVNSRGQKVFNDRVREGQLIVVPQFFASMMTAESNGIEWVSFKTSSLPMRSPIVGHNSVFKAMPRQVLANSYRIPVSQASELKCKKEQQMMLFPPSTTSS